MKLCPASDLTSTGNLAADFCFSALLGSAGIFCMTLSANQLHAREIHSSCVNHGNRVPMLKSRMLTNGDPMCWRHEKYDALTGTDHEDSGNSKELLKAILNGLAR